MDRIQPKFRWFVSKLAKLLPAQSDCAYIFMSTVKRRDMNEKTMQNKEAKDMNMNTNQEMNTKELDLNEAETVSGGKLRYKEIEKYLTEEQKKELEEFEKRVANS